MATTTRTITDLADILDTDMDDVDLIRCSCGAVVEPDALIFVYGHGWEVVDAQCPGCYSPDGDGSSEHPRCADSRRGCSSVFGDDRSHDRG